MFSLKEVSPPQPQPQPQPATMPTEFSGHPYSWDWKYGTVGLTSDPASRWSDAA